jgi:rhodanese-related sulfurtransferase
MQDRAGERRKFEHVASTYATGRRHQAGTAFCPGKRSSEWNRDVDGAINIPIRTLVKNLDKLPPDKGAAIIAECGSGHGSAMALMALGLLGYTNVRSLASGFAAWTKAGLPISK